MIPPPSRAHDVGSSPPNEKHVATESGNFLFFSTGVPERTEAITIMQSLILFSVARKVNSI